ncbi:MAG TPA: hypothetical protein VH374_10020 [Polyangia bacterium]|jgi:hypothetical protein|nr:hypothetical protein [Polyangia bacterium]
MIPGHVARRATRVAAVALLAFGTGCGSSGGRGPTDGAAGASPYLAKFSFFVISLEAVRAISGSQDGFGGDLGGLDGADHICAQAAEMGIAGAGAKTWRAFLSTSTVNAKDRVGVGPWYDALGRLVASDLAHLIMDRPADASPSIKNDLPNETGLPNMMDGAPGCTTNCPTNHQILTGSGADGTHYLATMPATDATCDDWTSKAPSGHPRVGHSYPGNGSGTSWISDEDGAGCAPCALADMPSVDGGLPACVGATGGYGAFYCFAENIRPN